jgi:hypothetical protein
MSFAVTPYASIKVAKTDCAAQSKRQTEDANNLTALAPKKKNVLRDYDRMTKDVPPDFEDVHKELRNFIQETSKSARCWSGYEPVPGKAPYSEGSCRPVQRKAKAKKPAAEKAAALTRLQLLLTKHAMGPGVPAQPPAAKPSLLERMNPGYTMPQIKTPDGIRTGVDISYDPAVFKLLQTLDEKYGKTNRLNPRDARRLQKAYNWHHTPDELDLIEGLMEMEEAYKTHQASLPNIKQAEGGAWTRAEGKSESGGLNAKGRASLKAQGQNIKPPVTESNPTGARADRKSSFCARMGGMKKKLTSSETANDPDSRINKALRKWNC